MKYLSGIAIGLLGVAALAVWFAPQEGQAVFHLLEDVIHQSVTSADRRVRAAESDGETLGQPPGEVDTDFGRTPRDFFGRSPNVPGVRRPPWPPRFDDSPASDLVAGDTRPSWNPWPENKATHLPNRNASTPGQATSWATIPDSASWATASESYPSTPWPAFTADSGRIRPVFDPMETQVSRLPAVGETAPGDTVPPVGSSAVVSNQSFERTMPENPSVGSVPWYQPPSQPAGVETGVASSPEIAGASTVRREEVVISDAEEVAVGRVAGTRVAFEAAALHSQHVKNLAEDLCEQTQVLARVGSDVILASEVLGAANEILLPYREKVPAVVYEQYRQQLMRQLLERRIEMKLVYQDIKRKIPAETLQKIEQEIGKHFEEKELPARLRKMGLSSVKEWEARLRSVGGSLEHEKRIFIETTLARDWIRQRMPANPNPLESSPEALWAYYQEHLAEFERPPEVRWQQIMVRRRAGRPEWEAQTKIAQLRERLLSGEPFEQVARTGSEGPTAAEGGLREPVQPGSLRSRTLEEALFSLPVGQISPILEDDQGYHVIRVLERREATRTPFAEAQVQIREKLAQEQREKQLAEYLQRLRREIPVWSVFADQSVPNSGEPVRTANR